MGLRPPPGRADECGDDARDTGDLDRHQCLAQQDGAEAATTGSA
jgi:hypothetical protein